MTQERPQAAAPAVPECHDEVCITCSDQAVAVTVVRLLDDDLALVDTGAGGRGGTRAFPGHATTSGVRTPGCSKNTCTSSQRTWYMVTCVSLTTQGSADRATSR